MPKFGVFYLQFQEKHLPLAPSCRIAAGLGSLEGADVPKKDRLGLVRTRDGDVLQRLLRVDDFFLIRSADEVVVARLVVDPERRQEVDAGIQRRQDVLDDVFLREPDRCNFRSIHVEIDLWTVESLVDTHIDCAGCVHHDVSYPFGNSMRHLQIVPSIRISIGEGAEVRYTASYCCVGFNIVRVSIEDGRGGVATRSVDIPVLQ